MSDSIGIMYPVEFSTHWAGGENLPEDLHCTVIYLGEIENANFTKDEIIHALDYVDLNMYIYCDISGKEMFGQDADIPVLRLNTDILYKNHTLVEGALGAVGIRSASEFKEYKPHITVDIYTYTAPPKSALLSPPELWWGDDKVALV